MRPSENSDRPVEFDEKLENLRVLKRLDRDNYVLILSAIRTMAKGDERGKVEQSMHPNWKDWQKEDFIDLLISLGEYRQ
jgi:hypothetical protein